MNAKILIVDDCKTARAFTSRVLRSSGYDVATAENIWISKLVGDFKPDLILMDVNLGASFKGTMAVSALKKRVPGVRYVLYSTLAAEKLTLLAEECGADAFIEKTASGQQLLDQVRRLLSAAGCGSQPSRNCGGETSGL